MEGTRGLDLATTQSVNGYGAVCLVLVAALMTLAGLVVGYHLPPERGEIGVIFPPWVAQADALSAVLDAGGLIAGVGRFPNIVIAYAADGEFGPRVQQHGAWFVAAARGLCASAEELPI